MSRTADARDAVVIGSGPNGLVAGITLAQAGWSVRVYEANDTIGGGVRSAELTLPGFIHDTCSAIYPLGIGSPVLDRLGLEQQGLEWIHPPLALAHPLDDGAAAVLDRSMDDTVASFGEPRDAAKHRSTFAPLAQQWPELAAEVLRPLHLPRHPLLMARFGMHSARSASGAAKALYRGERARALIAGLAAHSTLPLTQMPSAGFAMLLGVAGHAVGWPMPRGGAQRISDALASALRALGGEIITGQRIERFDQLPDASAFLFDLTPQQLVSIARDQLPAGYVRRLEQYKYGLGVFKVDWALSGPIPWTAEACRRAGTVHVGGTLEQIAEAERTASDGGHPDRPFVLLAQQSLYDDSRAPSGKHTGWAYCHVPNGSTFDMTERIEAQIERFAPGFRELILQRSSMNTQQMQEHNANYVGGDINGGAPALSQLFTRPVFRLTPYTTPNPRIFLCSSSTPPGGGVHGMCGFHAAQTVISRTRS